MWKCARCETLNSDDVKVCTLCQRARPETPAARPVPPSGYVPPLISPAPPDPLPSVRDLRKLRLLAATPALVCVFLTGSDIPVIPLLVLVGLWTGISFFVTLALQGMNLGGRTVTTGRVLGPAVLTGIFSLEMVNMYQAGNGIELLNALIRLMPVWALIHTVARIVIFVVNARRVSRGK